MNCALERCSKLTETFELDKFIANITLNFFIVNLYFKIFGSIDLTSVYMDTGSHPTS